MAVQEQLILETKVEGSGTASSKLKSLNSNLSGLSLSTQKLLGVAGIAGLAVGLKNLGDSAIREAARFEQSQVAFSTMLGNAEKAQDLLEELSEFAAKTPFTLQGVEDTAKQLLAMGIESENLISTMKTLGDIAAGVSVPIEQIALAYGQVRAANQLYGTELRQFVGAGIPLLGALADQMGVTKSEMKKMVEQGKVSFKDVEKAFEGMASEGGKFNNLMEAQSKTFNGMVSNLKDVISLFLRDAGDDFLDFGKDVVQVLINLAETQLPKIADVFLTVFSGSFEIVKKASINIASVWNEGLTAVSKITNQKLSETAFTFQNFISGVKTVIDGFVFAISNVFDVFGGGLRASFNAISGDFTEVERQLSQTLANLETNYSDFSNAVDEAGAEIIISQQQIGVESLSAISALEKFNKTDLTNITENFKKTGKASKSSKEEIEDLSKELIKLTSQYRDSGKDINETLKKLGQDHEENLSKINDKIKETKNEITELEKSFESLRSEQTKEFAEKVVDQEQKIKDIEQEIRDERSKDDTDRVRLESLKFSLKEEKAALEEANEFLSQLRVENAEEEMQILDQIDNAKRRARQTDLQNFVEDFKKKRAESLSNFNQEKELLGQKLEATREELRQEELANKLAQGRAEARLRTLNMLYESTMKRNTEITRQEINNQIEFFNRLEQSARRAMAAASLAGAGSSFGGARANGGPVTAGRTFLVGERGPELFTPAISGNITPNNKLDGNTTINISGVFGSDAAEEIGDMIIQKLNMTVAT